MMNLWATTQEMQFSKCKGRCPSKVKPQKNGCNPIVPLVKAVIVFFVFFLFLNSHIVLRFHLLAVLLFIFSLPVPPLSSSHSPLTHSPCSWDSCFGQWVGREFTEVNTAGGSSVGKGSLLATFLSTPIESSTKASSGRRDLVQFAVFGFVVYHGRKGMVVRADHS